MKKCFSTVLAVDDSAVERELIGRTFRKLGVEGQIEWVTSGDEAIAYLKGWQQFSNRSRFPFPTFILTDLDMPGGDGFSILKHLQNHPEMPVPTVVFSGSTRCGDVRRAYLMGAKGYIQKPIGLHELERVLKACCDYWALCESPLEA